MGGGGVELSPSGGGGGGGGGVCRTWWWWITRCPCASTPTPRYVSVTEQSEQSEHQSRVERVMLTLHSACAHHPRQLKLCN